MTLATYMHSFMSDIATELGWTVAAGSYDFPVADTIEAYGEATEILCTDAFKLHAIGKVKVLEHAGRATANSVDYSADTSSFKMSQLHAQAMEMLADARIGAMSYLPEYAVETGELTYPSDVYARVESLDTLDYDEA